MTGLLLGGDFVTFSYRQGVGLGSRVAGAFEGPRISFRPHYVFGGLYRFSREGTDEGSDTETFFGSIGEMDGVSITSCTFFEVPGSLVLVLF